MNIRTTTQLKVFLKEKKDKWEVFKDFFKDKNNYKLYIKEIKEPEAITDDNIIIKEGNFKGYQSKKYLILNNEKEFIKEYMKYIFNKRKENWKQNKSIFKEFILKNKIQDEEKKHILKNIELKYFNNRNNLIKKIKQELIKYRLNNLDIIYNDFFEMIYDKRILIENIYKYIKSKPYTEQYRILNGDNNIHELLKKTNIVSNILNDKEMSLNLFIQSIFGKSVEYKRNKLYFYTKLRYGSIIFNDFYIYNSEYKALISEFMITSKTISIEHLFEFIVKNIISKLPEWIRYEDKRVGKYINLIFDNKLESFKKQFVFDIYKNKIQENEEIKFLIINSHNIKVRIKDFDIEKIYENPDNYFDILKTKTSMHVSMLLKDIEFFKGTYLENFIYKNTIEFLKNNIFSAKTFVKIFIYQRKYIHLFKSMLNIKVNIKEFNKIVAKNSNIKKLLNLKIDEINNITGETFFIKRDKVVIKKEIENYTYLIEVSYKRDKNLFFNIIDFLNKYQENTSIIKRIKNRIECLDNNEDSQYILGLLKQHILTDFQIMDEFSVDRILDEKKEKEINVEKEKLFNKYLEKKYYPKFSKRNNIDNIIFFHGPTNSGKTYNAFNELLKSKSGLYLAPLRLLAVEGQMEINNRGKACNLITGEEKNIQQNANFTSCTIETIDLNRKYETVVIDEIQMLVNKERGYSWVNTLMNIKTKKLILVGNDNVRHIIQRFINKNIKYIEFFRKNELLFNGDIHMSDIKDKSAIISFSRNEVFRLKKEIEKMLNYKISVIYGNLPPEVKISESEKFNKGKTNILIATDAIGMGLNLPISNIIFSELEKFDGEEIRALEKEEIKQISGRAGRYSYSEEPGYVYLLTQDNIITSRDTNNEINEALVINNMLEKNTLIYIQPTYDEINQYSKLFKVKNLNHILRMLVKLVDISKYNMDYYIPTKLIDLSKIIDIYDFNIKDKYKFLYIPIDINYSNKTIFKNMLKHIYNNLEINIDNIFNRESIDLSINNIEEELEELENILHSFSIYKWFGQMYPNKIKDLEELKKMEKIIIDKIKSFLN